MNNQKTNINNDETRVDPNNRDNNKPQEKTETKQNEITEKKQNQSSTKSMAIGGLGMIGGAVAAMGLSAFKPAPSMNDPSIDGAANSPMPAVQEPDNIDDIKLAHTPNDDMSFNAAFAAARAEVGPHGVFEWRGGVYGTYYANEWDSFSDEYKAQFSNHNWKTDFNNDPQHIAQGPGDQLENHVADTDGKFGEHEIKIDENGNEYISLTDAISGEEVRITPDDLKYAVVDAHGELVGVFGDNENWTAHDGTPLEEPGEEPLNPDMPIVEPVEALEDLADNLLVDEDSANEPANLDMPDEPVEALEDSADNLLIAEEPEDIGDNNVVVLNAQYEDYGIAEEALAANTVDGYETAYIGNGEDGQYDITVVDDNPVIITENPELQHDGAFAMQDDSMIDYLADNNLPDYDNDASVDDYIA
ncbi:MAG: hypothetical protein LBL90_07955 [Prevotellaceae bacterium]|nr:hypothetical protein [Prevotellaceae bacterium]